MEEHTRDPKEDISYIRSILEKTTAGMKTVAPWFTGFGILWLVYGLLCAVLRLSQGLVSPAAQILMANAGAILSWVFYIALAAGFFVVRRKQKQNELGSPALKLLDMWGACILVFLFLSVFLVFVSILAVRGLALTQEANRSVQYTLSIARSFLIFLLPLLPLLITALFLEDRRMLWAGIVLTLLAAAFLGSHIVLLWGSAQSDFAVSPAQVTGWNAAACLLDVLPGVMLLLFGRQLKWM
jgi:hypothetical protein